MSKYFKRSYYMIGAVIMIFIIYKVSLFFLNIGLDGLSRQIFFLFICMYLYVPLMKSMVLKKSTSENKLEEQLKAGVEGERRVQEQLKELSDDCKFLYGKYVGSPDRKAEVDAIVFSKVGVFNIEVKNFSGTIKVCENSEGDEIWLREIGRKVEVFKSPSEQVRYHREVLSTVLEEEKIIDLIVIANDNTVIIDDEKSIVPIVNYNNLVEYINEYESEDEYSIDEEYETVNNIVLGDSDTYNKVNEEEVKSEVTWLFRSRFAIATFFFGLYIAKVISMA